MKLFYTGPVINAEMLVVILEKHDIAATQEFVEQDKPDDAHLNRPQRYYSRKRIMTGLTAFSTPTVKTN